MKATMAQKRCFCALYLCLSAVLLYRSTNLLAYGLRLDFNRNRRAASNTVSLSIDSAKLKRIYSHFGSSISYCIEGGSQTHSFNRKLKWPSSTRRWTSGNDKHHHSFRKNSGPLFCVGTELTPLPQPEGEFRRDSDTRWQTDPEEAARIVPVKRDRKYSVRPELITFDAFDTLIQPSQSVGRWYREALNTVCGMRVRLPRPALFANSFRVSYKDMLKEYPCFGATAGMSSRDWWFSVIRNTYVGTMDLNVVDSAEIDELMPELFDLLYNEIFGTKEGWQVKEEVDYVLGKLAEWRDQGAGPKLGVLSNFDERLHTILQELELSQYFDFVVTSYEVGAEKPDPKIFQAAIAAASSSMSTSPASSSTASAHSDVAKSEASAGHTESAGSGIEGETTKAISEQQQQQGEESSSEIDPKKCFHIGNSLETDVVGAVGAGWEPMRFNENFDESFPDWFAIESIEEADEGFQKRRALLEWGRRDVSRSPPIEWMELWGLSDVLTCFGFPEEEDRPIRTTVLRGFLEDE